MKKTDESELWEWKELCFWGPHCATPVQQSVAKNVPLLSGSEAHPAVCQTKHFSWEGGISQEHILHSISAELTSFMKRQLFFQSKSSSSWPWIHGHPVWLSIASFLPGVTKVIIVRVDSYVCSGDIFLQFHIFSVFSDLHQRTPYWTSDSGWRDFLWWGDLSRQTWSSFQASVLHSLRTFHKTSSFRAGELSDSVLTLFQSWVLFFKKVLQETKLKMLKSPMEQNCLFLLCSKWLLLQAPLQYAMLYWILLNYGK